MKIGGNVVQPELVGNPDNRIDLDRAAATAERPGCCDGPGAAAADRMPPVVNQMFRGDDTVTWDGDAGVLHGHDGRLQIETDEDDDLDLMTLLKRFGGAA
ncbi:hypothetical protein [Roseivivax sediminis]|uniref:Uncharacterized protein n=1 Tax=Roseivivax sediminis TaxID=936889 RepID=A0A1I1U0W9_9RHOB|nr:hypothetical protein [Roseivivax sediminis]SFD64506.1 hypothetical protein SAMN04515678_10291 [Roseivivax sediminis]